MRFSIFPFLGTMWTDWIRRNSDVEFHACTVWSFCLLHSNGENWRRALAEIERQWLSRFLAWISMPCDRISEEYLEDTLICHGMSVSYT